MSEKKEAWFPVAYWPPIDFFSLVYPNGKWIVEQHEHYIKQTGRNRCVISGANGRQTLIVPIKRKRGKKTPIRDVMLDLSQDWQRIHWLALESAYGSSPFYEFYKDEIRRFYTLAQPLSSSNTIYPYLHGVWKSCRQILA